MCYVYKASETNNQIILLNKKTNQKQLETVINYKHSEDIYKDID